MSTKSLVKEISEKSGVTLKDIKDLYVSLARRARKIEILMMSELSVADMDSSIEDLNHTEIISDIIKQCIIGVAGLRNGVHVERGIVDNGDVGDITYKVDLMNSELDNIVNIHANRKTCVAK